MQIPDQKMKRVQILQVKQNQFCKREGVSIIINVNYICIFLDTLDSYCPCCIDDDCPVCVCVIQFIPLFNHLTLTL